MHVAWSYCQAVGFVAKRKRNQLEQFKKEESAGAQKTKMKIVIKLVNNISIFKRPSRPMMLQKVAQHPGNGFYNCSLAGVLFSSSL